MRTDAAEAGESKGKGRVGVVEANSVSFVPQELRHGHVRDLFTLWFTTNIAPLPIVTGAMIAAASKLSLPWCISAIVTGHVLGGLVLAACSAQGPKMGLAQMIQARGQFGRFGALLIVSISAVLYLGFFTSNTVLAGRALHGLAPVIGAAPGAVAAALGAAAIGILGYNAIHLLNRIGIWFMAAALAVAFAILLGRTPAAAWSFDRVDALGWFLCFSTSLVWNVSYACYTSDYSRYLPDTVGIARPFMASFAGAASGASLTFVFGAVVAAASPNMSDPMQALTERSGAVGPVLLFLFVPQRDQSQRAQHVRRGAVADHHGTDLHRVLEAGRRARLAVSAVVLTGCLVAATAFSQNFVQHFINLVVALLVVLVPWATINICDFYLVTRGRYDIVSFFRRDGGRYGLFDLPACTAFVAGVAVQLPFTANAYVVGPFAHLLHGVDIGWLVAPPVALIVFLGSRGARSRKVLVMQREGLL